jgi:hypothetical protein
MWGFNVTAEWPGKSDDGIDEATDSDGEDG